VSSSKDDLMQMVASRPAGPIALLDLRPITTPFYPNDFVAYRFDPTALITTLDDAKATAESLLSTSAVALSGSAFRSGADPGPWDQLAFAPLTCLLFAASPTATGLGMEWTLEASENLDALFESGPYQTTFDPGWAAAAAWTGDRLFEARVRTVLGYGCQATGFGQDDGRQGAHGVAADLSTRPRIAGAGVVVLR
jgi:hypothetical protein